MVITTECNIRLSKIILIFACSNSVAFHPHGNLAATAASDWFINVWDWRASKIVHTLKDHEQIVSSNHFQPLGIQDFFICDDCIQMNHRALLGLILIVQGIGWLQVQTT